MLSAKQRRLKVTRGRLAGLIVVVLTALLISPVGALPSYSRAEETSKPAAEMAQLKFLEGQWEYSITAEQGVVSPDVVPKLTTGTRKTIAGPGGFSQITDLVVNAPEGKWIEHEVTVWDSNTRTYKSYVFSSTTPECEIRIGRWMNGKLVFEHDWGMGFSMQLVTVMNADGTVTTSYNDTNSSSGRLIFTEHAKRVG
jgi:hypothetical protein